MSNDGITRIADDIIQVQVPLPYVLNIVNCYLLRGADGWTLVDTGLNTAAARPRWQSALATLDIKPADIKKIVLTHMHPDHYGMAGWWQRQTETPIPLFVPERGTAANANLLPAAQYAALSSVATRLRHGRSRREQPGGRAIQHARPDATPSSAARFLGRRARPCGWARASSLQSMRRGTATAR